MAPHITSNPSSGLDIAIATGRATILGPTPHTHERRVALRVEGFDFFGAIRYSGCPGSVVPKSVTGSGRCTVVSIG